MSDISYVKHTTLVILLTNDIMLPSVGNVILNRASRDVHDNFPYKLFEARWAFIVTWYNVTFYGATSEPYPV